MNQRFEASRSVYITSYTRAAMLEVARQLRQDLGEKILDEPQMLGVEELSDSGIKLRMQIKTAPFEQAPVKRELLLRIMDRFEKEGIEIPPPQRALWVHMLQEKEKREKIPEG